MLTPAEIRQTITFLKRWPQKGRSSAGLYVPIAAFVEFPPEWYRVYGLMDEVGSAKLMLSVQLVGYKTVMVPFWSDLLRGLDRTVFEIPVKPKRLRGMNELYPR